MVTRADGMTVLRPWERYFIPELVAEGQTLITEFEFKRQISAHRRAGQSADHPELHYNEPDLRTGRRLPRSRVEQWERLGSGEFLLVPPRDVPAAVHPLIVPPLLLGSTAVRAQNCLGIEHCA